MRARTAQLVARTGKKGQRLDGEGEKNKELLCARGYFSLSCACQPRIYIPADNESSVEEFFFSYLWLF